MQKIDFSKSFSTLGRSLGYRLVTIHGRKSSDETIELIDGASYHFATINTKISTIDFYHKNGKILSSGKIDNFNLQGVFVLLKENGDVDCYEAYKDGIGIDLSIHDMDSRNLTKDQINLLKVLYG